VPEQVIQSIGIPKEILGVVDIRKIQIDTVNVFYILLESLGLYFKTDKSLQLVSDYYKREKVVLFDKDNCTDESEIYATAQQAA
jgi:hypothetical protein